MAELPDLSGVYLEVLENEGLNNVLLAGDSFEISYNIQNLTLFGAGFFDVGFYLSDNPQISKEDLLLGEETFDNGLLGSGTTGIVTKTLTLPNTASAFWERSGKYYIGYLVDAGEFVVEENETNNSNTGNGIDYSEISVITKADLFGEYFDVKEEPLFAGKSFDIDFAIENGLPLTTGSFDVNFYLSKNKYISELDYALGSYTINSLTGNTKTEGLIVNLTLPDASNSFWDGDANYYIGMIVDGGLNGSVLETDEANNSNRGEFLDSDGVEIQILPDLSGQLFNVTVEPLKAGDKANIDFVIQNTSAVNVDAFEVRFYISENNYISPSDRLLGIYQITSLAGNTDTGVINVDFDLPSVSDSFWESDGEYHIGMIVDPLQGVRESNKNNNSNQGEFSDSDAVDIKTLADLSATLFDVKEEPLVAKDNFTIEYSIQNNSLISVDAFNVDFYLSKNDFISTQDKLLGSVTVNNLAGENNTDIRSKNFTLPDASDSFWEGDGTYYMGMIVDSGNAIAETNENNNQNTGIWLDFEDVDISLGAATEVNGISPSLEDSLGFNLGIIPEF